jgi:two-component system LytT family response regulator
MIRVLLVDDEPPARDRLRQLLAGHDDVTIAGEAEDGVEAIERVAELAPDLLMLDIQMPGCSGLEVAASLPHPRPAIVFCTAYEQYAVDAFEVHAVDYLLKPVNRARLQAALDRVRAATPARDAAIDRAIRRPPLAPLRFLARKGAR